MAEEVILKVGVEGTGDGETKIKSLKAQLKEMKNELLGLDEGSERFKTLSKQAGELTDKIGDVNDKVNALASDTKKLDALVGVGSAIVGGFQAASGVMALFGSESKEVEKAIQNIVAAQGILNGVQQVGQFLTAKGIVQTALWGEGTMLAAAKVKIATAAQKLWNLALSANPLMLLVAGITAAVGAFALFTKGANSSAAGQKALNDAVEEGDKAAAKEESTIKILTATVLNHNTSLKDKRKAIEDINAISPEYLGNITLENIGTQESIESINQYIQSIRTKIELQALEAQLQETIAERLEITRRIRNDEMELTDPKRLVVLKEEENSILQMIQLRQTSNQELQKEADLKGSIAKAGEDVGATGSTVRVETAKTESNELADIERERLEQELEDQKRADEARFEYETNIRAADFKAQEDLNALKLQQEADQLNAEFDLYEANIDKQNALDADREAKNKERRATALKLTEEYTAAVTELTKNIFTITNNLGKQDEESRKKRAKRQFEIKKALDMAEAAIDGTKAVLSTFANTPGGLVLKAAAASLAGVFAAAKIAAIGSAKFDGGASVSGSVGGGGDAGASASNVGNVTPNIQGIPAGSTLLNQPTQKVVVVESDITKVQKKVSVIESQATYG